jgi:hypothetical protein
MTPEQPAVVHESYQSLGREATSMAADFYRRLFAANRSTQALYSDGPETMAVKFVAELDAIVEGIASFDEFRLRAADLGARHAAYGGMPSTTSPQGGSRRLPRRPSRRTMG